MTTNMNSTGKRVRHLLAGLVLVGLLLALAVPVLGQESEQANAAADDAAAANPVQVLHGRVEVGDNVIYVLPRLRAGQTLYVHAAGTSGNLDPMVGISEQPLDSEMLQQSFWDAVRQAIDEERDPVEALPEIYGQVLTAWDDDSGDGYDAALAYEIPDDGDYYLLVSRSPTQATFGAFTLTVGIDEPAVLDGGAEPAGDVIAIFDETASELRARVQQVEGELTEEEPVETLVLGNLREGDVLYAYVEALSGGLKPQLILQDYGGKMLRTGNFGGQESVAKLTYRVEETGGGHALQLLTPAGEGGVTGGSYRLQVGVNSPAVLSGDAAPIGDALLQEPIEVQVGVELQQITNLDQVSENFGAVTLLRMAWHDPALAFSPDECNCTVRVMTLAEFGNYVKEKGAFWPEFTIFNQQGNRWTQNRNIVVQSSGVVDYQERFTTDFQAPDFDFTDFPFDSQQLYIRVNSLYPERYYTYAVSDDFTGIGDQLGEEEWFITDWDAEATIEDGKSRYALGFQVERYLIFYIFRIFVPIILVIIVSWFTFFLRDYGKRVDVAGANLLVFVAFNFTISGELPRLGYLTFMDVVLIGTFVISALVVMFNVLLKRMELNGKRELAEKIDAYSIWVYPLAYTVGGILAYFMYLR